MMVIFEKKKKIYIVLKYGKYSIKIGFLKIVLIEACLSNISYATGYKCVKCYE